MDWQKRIDREPVKKVWDLASMLATAKMRELVATGNTEPGEEIALLHARFRARCMRLLAQGILVQAISSFRGNVEAIQAYFDECDYNQALRNRETVTQAMSFPEQDARSNHEDRIKNSPNPAMLELILNTTPGPLPINDTPLVRRYPKSKVDDSREIALLIEIGDIEITPAEAVRWMVETNEGDDILPHVLKKYLSMPEPEQLFELSGTQEPEWQRHIIEWEAVIAVLVFETEKVAAHLAIAKWRGLSHQEAFDALSPRPEVKDIKNYVRKKMTAAEKIARDHGLTMPVWGKPGRPVK